MLHVRWLALASLPLLALANCSSNQAQNPTTCEGASCGGGPLIENGFESDDPSGRSQPERGGASADGGTAASSAPSDSSNAQRAVEEADIIKLDGTRLYALSRYGGLSIVDASDPEHLRLLGRKRTDGVPFEMYVRDGRAYVMINNLGRWVSNVDGYYYGGWQETSEILALDVHDPSAITELTHFDVPGDIADSRIVGDALYLVTYENGYCWGCQANAPATIVTSFNVAGASIQRVDGLRFSSSNNAYVWQRSVASTDKRLYIAGPEWSWQPGQKTESVIDVVDISNPTGILTKGASVPVAGQINSRWQMDEYQGVLRVVSQFQNGWNGNAAAVNPKVQTFTIQSSSSITPLGTTELKLPSPESLQSVRFDGPRAYAITSQRTDPLFTVDLSAPATPKQAGELVMPGFLFFMEPRGDRLVGFGYDDTNRSAANLAVSLFDVADLANPKMLSRVSFGSGWGTVAEDIDRIHKSVQVLDDKGLILVPFASYGRWTGTTCETPQSGIQLIDYGRDALTLRGLAPQLGMPRRAIVTGTHLLGVSDRNVTSFDIQNRDAPTPKQDLDLSTPAYRTAELPNHVVSLSSDWWNGEVGLALTPKANADAAAVVGKLSLASLAPKNQYYCGNGGSSWASWYQARLFTNGNLVYMTVPVYSYDASYSHAQGTVVVAAIDATDPTAPKLVGQSTIALTSYTGSGYSSYGGFWDGYAYFSYYGGAVLADGEGVVQVGSKLAYLEVQNEYKPYTNAKGVQSYDVTVHRAVHVVDFADPTHPAVAPGIDLGTSLGSAPLLVKGSTVLTSRWLPSPVHPGKVRFYMDQVDLSGATPTLLASVNTPGSLLMIDEPTSRIVTSDYAVTRTPSTDWQACQNARGRHAWFDYESGECILVSRSLKLADVAPTNHVTLRSTLPIGVENVSGVRVAEDRVYLSRNAVYDYTTCTGAAPCLPAVAEEGGMSAVGGIRAGTLSVVSELKGDARWPAAARGTKVALYTDTGLSVYDTSAPTAKLLTEARLRGWGYTSFVAMSDDHMLCSLGEFGLQSISF